MKIQCPSCDQRLEIPEELAGQTIECPACNASLVVPSLATPPPSPVQVQQSAPQVTASEEPKSSIPKWAIASVAGIAVLGVCLIIFYPDDSDDQDAALQSNRLEELEDSASKLSDVLDRTSEMTDQLKKNLAIPYLGIHDAAGKGNIEAVKQYLAAGTDVNEKSVLYKYTPLHDAVQEGHKEIAELLIDAGADLEAKAGGVYRGTPLHKAAYRGHRKIVELLLSKGANINAKNRYGNTPLYYALLNDNFDTADIIRNNGGKFGGILQAAEYGDVKSVKEFMDLGADINAKGGLRGGTALTYSAIENNVEIVKFLINAGANVNAKDKYGVTPLRCTTNEEIIKLLVAKGADINLKNKEGETKLDNAILYGNSDLANILRKHGGKTSEELKAEGK